MRFWIRRSPNSAVCVWCQAAVVAMCLLVWGPPALSWGQTKDFDSLRWQLNADSRYDVELTKQITTQSTVGGRMRQVEIDCQFRFGWQVARVDAETGNMTVQQVLESVRLESGAPGDFSAKRLVYDSTDAKYRSGVSGAVFQELKTVIGLTHRFTMTPEGEFVSIDFPDEESNKLAKIPDYVPIKKWLQGEQLKANLSALTWIPQPATAAASDTSANPKNKSWSKVRTVKTTLGDFSRTDQYRLASSPTNDGSAGSALAVQIDSTGEPQADTPLKNFKGSGQILFDTAGYVRSSQFKTEVTTQTPYRDLSIKSVVTAESQMKIKPSK